MEATVDPSSPGSRLDADHPKNGVLIPCLFTHDIHLQVSNDLPVADEAGMTDAELEALALRMIEGLEDQPEVVRRILDRLPLTAPFSRDPDSARRLSEKLLP